MIPQPVVATFYLAAAVALAATGRTDFTWAKPPRLFLTIIMGAWAVYWWGVWQMWDLRIMHVLGRWLHIPTAIAVILIAMSRWYAERKGGP